MIWPTNDHLSRSVSAHYPGRCRHLRLPRYGNSAWRGLQADAGWKQALLPTYHNKVKCIYIDPPYNTGNEGWAYNDNVNSPMMQDWLGKTVDRDDLTRHDKWCCMICLV